MNVPPEGTSPAVAAICSATLGATTSTPSMGPLSGAPSAVAVSTMSMSPLRRVLWACAYLIRPCVSAKNQGWPTGALAG